MYSNFSQKSRKYMNFTETDKGESMFVCFIIPYISTRSELVLLMNYFHSACNDRVRCSQTQQIYTITEWIQSIDGV